MQKPPQLLPTTLEDGQAPGIKYRIDGELVPVLHTWLDGTVPVFFEHHVVLWKDPALNIGIRAMKAPSSEWSPACRSFSPKRRVPVRSPSRVTARAISFPST